MFSGSMGAAIISGWRAAPERAARKLVAGPEQSSRYNPPER
jgi:hypothetical protein